MERPEGQRQALHYTQHLYSALFLALTAALGPMPHYTVCLLTHWSLLIGEECGLVAAVHVGHTYVISVCPVQLPEGGHREGLLKTNQWEGAGLHRLRNQHSDRTISGGM